MEEIKYAVSKGYKADDRDRCDRRGCLERANFHIALYGAVVMTCPPHTLEVLKGELPGAEEDKVIYGAHPLAENCILDSTMVFDNHTQSCHPLEAEDLRDPIGRAEDGRFIIESTEAHDAHHTHRVNGIDGSPEAFTCAYGSSPEDRCNKPGAAHLMVRYPNSPPGYMASVITCPMHTFYTVMGATEGKPVTMHPMNPFCHMPGSVWKEEGCEMDSSGVEVAHQLKNN
jgi:hypothetical protein